MIQIDLRKVFLVLLLISAYVFWAQLPDIRRYLRMRSM
jgi:hypothetical protein